MSEMKLQKFTSLPMKNVCIKEGFWAVRQEINRTATLDIEFKQCKNTGRIDAWKLNWNAGEPNQPHHYWDSDVAKWIEAAAYSLINHYDPELEQKIDEVIDLIASAQHEEGYLNIYYSVVEPDKRFTNLKDMHELYCAGHLVEAAVAYDQATGKKKLLEVMCRYIDCIDANFGSDDTKIKGYDGHPEIELALVKLYKTTNNERYLRLAKFFVDQRGCQPHFFDIQSKENKSAAINNQWVDDPQGRYAYYLAHLPVREQKVASGHAVRAMYLYSGMADIALETGDEELLKVCEMLWNNMAQRQMYITGGIGPKSEGERFTFDYDLYNPLSYNETCASIGLVFWAHRMLHAGVDVKYADAMETALYNNILGGVSLTGDRFYYANPLAVYPESYMNNEEEKVQGPLSMERREWFDCACCPPNLARFLASLGGYIYTVGVNEIYVHLYIQSEARMDLHGKQINITQTTKYPWEGNISFVIQTEEKRWFTLALRLPGWCRKAELKVNNCEMPVEPILKDGYMWIDREWTTGDMVTLNLSMPVERMESHPSVRSNCGRIAIVRGPVVYCMEEIDNGKYLDDIVLPANTDIHYRYDPDLLGGVVVLTGKGQRRDVRRWNGGALYLREEQAVETMDITAVPFFARTNRGPGEMIVWMLK